MKLVYVAGPFSAPTREGVEENIAAAVQAGLELSRRGIYPVIPHANTAHPDFEKTQDYQFWIDGTMALLLRCDEIFMLANWRDSKGATAEHDMAKSLGMPITYQRSIEEVLHHLHG